MKTLRVTLVSETYIPQINGVSRTLDRLVRHLVTRGNRVQLVIPLYEGMNSAPPSVEKREWRAFGLPFYKEVLLPVARTATVRRAMEGFCPDLVHIATEGPLGLAGLRAAQAMRVTTVGSYHTNFPQYLADYGAGMLESLSWRYLRWFHNQTRATFCPTPSIRDLLVEKEFENVRIWGRGVDCGRFDPGKRDLGQRQRLGVGPDDLLFVYAGRLAAEKNLEMLLDAWRMLPRATHCKLLLIGDGPLRGRLERMADERVIFAGYRHNEELAQLYACGDLFAFPSLTETFGNVILEAMASGMPAVGFDVPGPRDIIRPDATGLIVGKISAAALADTLGRLSAQAEALRTMGAAARRYAETQTWDNIHNGLLNDYSEIMNGTS
jgi:glycosyltransferase involved in cell wall biosynthesis